MFELLVVTLALLQSASALQVNLHHRVFVPKAPSQPSFTYKGSIEIESIAGITLYNLHLSNCTHVFFVFQESRRPRQRCTFPPTPAPSTSKISFRRRLRMIKHSIRSLFKFPNEIQIRGHSHLSKLYVLTIRVFSKP